MRKRYVDWMKTIAIILVIVGHTNFANSWCKSWIYAFHMPLFFFASGLVLKQEPLGSWFSKKSRALLVPFVLWGLIYAEFSFESLAKLIYGSYRMISAAGSLTSLWFLPAMFLALLIIQLVWKWLNSPTAVLAAAAGFTAISMILPQLENGYPWCLDAAFLAAAFILIGYGTEQKTAVIKSAKFWSAAALVGLLLLLTVPLNPVNRDSNVLMAGNFVGNPLWFWTAAIGGCSLVFSVSHLLGNTQFGSKAVRFIGENTLVIFAVQKPIISGFEHIFRRFPMPSVVELLITSAGTLAITCAAAVIINRYAPCLAGRYSARTQN